MNDREPSPSANRSSNPHASVSDSRAEQLLDAVFDRDLVRRQHHGRPAARALEHAPERRQQAEQIDLELRLVGVAGGLGHAGVRAAELRAAQRLAVVQQLRRRLVLLVLEQAAHQRLARILLGFGVLLRRVGTRQQRARLDVNQRRRHHQELPGHVEVQLLHQIDVAEVLLGDERDRDVVDVHLVLANEVQQEIERTLEARRA